MLCRWGGFCRAGLVLVNVRWESKSEESAKDRKGVAEDSMVSQEATGTLWPNFTLGLLPWSKG